MAAATSFYAGLSLLPLLIVVISGLGLLFETTEFGASARDELLRAVELEGSPLIRDQVDRVLDQISQGASLGGPLGLVGLLFGAMTIFAQFERAFDRIWNVEDQRKFGAFNYVFHVLLRRFRAFLMLCTLGLLVLAIFIASLIISAAEQMASQWWAVPYVFRAVSQWGVSIALNTIVFTLLYRFVPKVEVRWREAFWGAILVSVGWELGRHALSEILLHTHYLNAYGAIGSFLAVLLWLYYVSHLIFVGAEFIQVICENCDHDADDCDS